MKMIYFSCLFGCILSQVLAATVPPPVCVEGNKTYGVGETFYVGCTGDCECYLNDGVASSGCVSMCPPYVLPDGCHFVPNPEKDEATSSNCCDVEQCIILPPIVTPPPFPVCEEGGVIIPEGHLKFIGGTKWCGCSEGKKQCYVF